jgi:hypothetical protein
MLQHIIIPSPFLIFMDFLSVMNLYSKASYPQQCHQHSTHQMAILLLLMLSTQTIYPKNSYKPRPHGSYYNNNSSPLLPYPVSTTNRLFLRPNTSTNPQLSNSTHASRISCQICFKPGHTGKLCYRRYNTDPEWQPNPRFQAYNAQIISHAQSNPSALPQAPVSIPSTTDMPNSS